MNDEYTLTYTTDVITEIESNPFFDPNDEEIYDDEPNY